jgi:predicted transcriptional regulator
MNNRTLKRPMFRMGGSTNSGITSGLQSSRQNYAMGDIVKDTREGMTPEVIESYRPYPERPKGEGMSRFLTSFGLNLASTSPTQGLLSAMATSAKGPTEQLYADIDAQRMGKTQSEADLFKMMLEGNIDIAAAGAANEGGAKMAVELQKVAQLEKIIPKIYDIESQLKDESLTPEERDKLEIELDVLKTSRNNLSKNNPITAATLELFVKSSAGQNLYNSLAENAVKQDKIDGTNLYTGTEDPKLYPVVIAEIQKILGQFASGGRVGYNMGGDVMQEQIGMDMQTPQGNMAMEETIDERVAPQNDNPISFDQLRARLPKEITDDIINLMTSSAEALEDFAMISTQQDVDQFNKKYSVNLVLPAEA